MPQWFLKFLLINTMYLASGCIPYCTKIKTYSKWARFVQRKLRNITFICTNPTGWIQPNFEMMLLWGCEKSFVLFSRSWGALSETHFNYNGHLHCSPSCRHHVCGGLLQNKVIPFAIDIYILPLCIFYEWFIYWEAPRRCFKQICLFVEQETEAKVAWSLEAEFAKAQCHGWNGQRFTVPPKPPATTAKPAAC